LCSFHDSTNSSRKLAVLLAVSVCMASVVGCEIDTYLDNPSGYGYYEVTPITHMIIKKLDVIEEAEEDPPNLTPVRASDLDPEPAEYVIGIGDVVTIAVENLVESGSYAGVSERVSDMGIFRHDILGDIKVDGLTIGELEKMVAELARKQGHVKDPKVRVFMRRETQRTFSVIGQPTFGVRLGRYQIPGADFTMLDAAAMIGGIPGKVRRLFIIRRARLVKGERPQHIEVEEPAINAVEMIINVIENGDDEDSQQPPDPSGMVPPRNLQDVLDPPDAAPDYVYVQGKGGQQGQWVKAYQSSPAVAIEHASPRGNTVEKELPEVVQRVIELPFDKLRKGDLRYNIIIRPGDIIQVPAPTGGNVYLMGAVGRPGTYGLPGENRLTLKQLVASAGGLRSTSAANRVDLTRRIDSTHEATVRLDLKEIINGNEPDIFLKPDDTINIGTSFMAVPVSLARSGIRFSYGFGFVLDRNFDQDVFGQRRR